MRDFDQKNMAEVTYLCVEAEVLRKLATPNSYFLDHLLLKSSH